MEYKVLKYLDEFVGYEWWDQHQGFLIETARNNYYATLSDADRKELNRLKQDYERMRRLYFHNKYKPEFYEKEELFERDAMSDQRYKTAKLPLKQIFYVEKVYTRLAIINKRSIRTIYSATT
jgi:hypothetical protein